MKKEVTPWAIRFRPKELKKFKAEAEREGLTLAAWVRRSLNQAIGPDLRERLERLEAMLYDDE